MACGATLKRTHEFDSLHSPGRSPKRMCGELVSSPKSQCPNFSHPAAFVEAAHKLTNGQQHAYHHANMSALASPNRGLIDQLPSSLPLASASTGRLSLLGDESPPRLASSPTARSASASSSSTTVAKDQPILSLTQVDLICRRLVAEHDSSVREQFDQILNNKLAEQYEMFLKFNHDQVRRKFDAEMSDCSYVS